MKPIPYSYAIVIVTYNRLHMLKNCLEHAFCQTMEPEAVIVVDNASTDGTTEYLEEIKENGFQDASTQMQAAANTKILIYHEKENVGGAGGFSDGMKIAMRYTKAEWILVIDDDAILDYDCAEKMDPRFQTGDKETPVQVVACAVYYKGELELNHRQDEKGPVSAKCYEQGPLFCKRTSFCGSMFHRSLIEKIGYPRKDYFIWFDDTEYSLRAAKYSDILVIPEAKLQHGDPNAPDRRAVVDWRYYYGTRNQLDMLRRHRKVGRLVAFNIEVRLIVLLRYLRLAIHVLNKERRKQDLYEAAIFRDGRKDGMRGNLGKRIEYLPGKRE
ncbi:MAG: glycosyltransferase [Lachnospiraceae bacterium]|nr:glycosyltransferase [Lachnospiraceae bacterium]